MICVPITSPRMPQALEDLAAAEALADIVEFRIDLIQDPDLAALIGAARKPVIVTNRTKLEGGQFRGTDEQRVDLLRQAAELGAGFIDIEVSTPRDLLKSVVEMGKKSGVILSFHDFTKTPDQLAGLYELMCEFPGDNVIKIVTYAQNITDNLQIFQLHERARRDRRRLISFCMGEKGEISRILSPLFGGFLTFGALETGKESAPGQILASTLKHVYRVDRPRGAFKIFGVIGNPVSKSMGPVIHNRAFGETGSPDIYVPFLVDNVETFFKGFEPYFEGLSVTMPFKEKIPPLLDAVEDTAKKIGAVNTVVREKGKWKGYNTDCIGALQALEAHTRLEGKRVLIVGSGGTAKAIGHGLAQRGAKLTVTYNKNKERGEQLARELDCRAVPASRLGEETMDVLINCSPVGMSPNFGESPVPADRLKPGMIVFDSVYNPMETRLLKEAKAAGCLVISGIELFLNQAAAQFELWTGAPAPKAAMREALMDKLQ